MIGRKTRQFLRKVFSAGLASKQQKNPTSCNITLPKAREAAMAENGTHETGLSKTISEVERGRREVAVDYARPSVGLEGFSLSASDEEHAQRFINGKSTSAILCSRVVPWRIQKLSHDEEILGGWS
ncbi:antitoxin VbhA family protein [Verticiella sediminum]|uniref:antitoxin VbhA family protein n=1 Tax=Verticiella sediminum TaxID=1247510 RepID=UPI001FE89F3B|nr:antitoxin VbhA family protein [Verticiella sediminum]